MTPKEAAIAVIQQLSADASFDEIIEDLSIFAAIERAQADFEAGRVISHEEMVEETRSWSVSRNHEN